MWEGQFGLNELFSCETCEHTCSSEGKDDISQQVRQAAYEIIEGKGATYYAVALALRRIAESILREGRSRSELNRRTF